MDLNKNQILFLVEISKQDGKRSVSELGKRIWNTAVSSYNNMCLLRDGGYIALHRRKNTIIPNITALGKMQLNAYFNVTKALNSD